MIWSSSFGGVGPEMKDLFGNEIKGDKMQAFHNDPKIKTKYVKRVLAHQKADRIIQRDQKNCAVGCTLDGNYDHKQYEVELGIPEWLARLEDTLFEGMKKEDALVWPAKFLKAVNVGSDLEKIKIPYLIYLLNENIKVLDGLKVKPEFKHVIAVIKLSKDANLQMIEALKSGSESAAESAASAAMSAAGSAWSAAESAVGSARSAAGSAWSAESAAWSAAGSAAESAVGSAWSAAGSAWSAAGSAWSAESAARSAWSAAESAAGSAVGSAAGSAAFKKHADKLLEMISECK